MITHGQKDAAELRPHCMPACVSGKCTFWHVVEKHVHQMAAQLEHQLACLCTKAGVVVAGAGCDVVAVTWHSARSMGLDLHHAHPGLLLVTSSLLRRTLNLLAYLVPLCL